MLLMGIILTVSINLMISCQTNKVIETKYIIDYPQLYFPKYPEPKKNVLPLDVNGKVVKDNDTEIVNVIMPLWYYKMIVEYKVRVDEAKTTYDSFVLNADKIK